MNQEKECLQKREIFLPSPLFRDPIYDCPTDLTVIWNEEEKEWVLLYTQRRASDEGEGVSWVHGLSLIHILPVRRFPSAFIMKGMCGI